MFKTLIVCIMWQE